MANVIHSITSMPAPFNMVVLVMLIVMGASVIGAVAKQIRKYACHRQELEFKRELVDRGMSADEIERVVRATSPNAESESCLRS